MNVSEILTVLRSERDRIDQVIVVLERLASGKRKEKAPARPLRKETVLPG